MMMLWRRCLLKLERLLIDELTLVRYDAVRCRATWGWLETLTVLTARVIRLANLEVAAV